jgi:hypothetical protein
MIVVNSLWREFCAYFGLLKHMGAKYCGAITLVLGDTAVISSMKDRLVFIRCQGFGAVDGEMAVACVGVTIGIVGEY